MPYTTKISMPLLLAICMVKMAFGTIKSDTISAEQIVDRSIEFCGGKTLLNGVTSIETIKKIATAKGDTLSFAVKRAGFDKYYFSVLSQAYENSTTI